MVDLLGTGGQLRLGAAVDDVDLGPQPLGAAGGIHSHVAAAYHGHLLVVEHGGWGIVLVGLHQVDAGQVLVGGVHANQGLAGDLHEHGQARAGADEDGLEAVLLEQLGDGEHLADDHIQLNLHAHLLQLLHFPLNHRLGQTELGDAVAQHASGHMEGLKDGDLIAETGQLAGAGQAGGAGADDRYLVTVAGDSLDLFVVAPEVGPVRNKALDAADSDGLTLDAPDAHTLALGLLGTDTARDGGQSVGGGEDLVGPVDVAVGHLAQKVGDGDTHRAAADAGTVLAVQAAVGLVHSRAGGVAQRHLFEILDPVGGVLVPHEGPYILHISHSWHLLPGGRGGPLSPWSPVPDRSRCGQ